jgi:outer membrane protein OmpA-like peptidoglycan-associated protein
MKFLGRAGILLLTSLFLVSTAHADGGKSDGKGASADATVSAATDSATNPAADVTSNAAAQPTVAATASAPADPAGAQPSPMPAPEPAPSRTLERGEHARRWDPMPALDGNPGLFTLETGETLPKGAFDIAVSFNKYSSMPGNLTLFQVLPSFAIGINRWFSIFAEFQPYDHLHVGIPSELSLNTPLTNPQFNNTIYRSLLPGTGDPPAYAENLPFASHSGGSYGEVDLGFKIGLLSERRGNWASLSIRNDFFLPTRTGLKSLLSNQVQYGNFSYGIGLEASKTILNRTITVAANWSYRFMREQTFNVPGGTPTVQVLDLADQMGAGLGMLIFPDKRFNIMTEYAAVIYTRQGLPNTTLGPRDPVNNVTGIRFYLAKHVAIEAGYRYALNLSNHLDRNGFVAKLAVAHWPEKPRVPDLLTSSCSVDKPSAMEGSNELVQATATANDSNGHPLTYNWTATGGTISGSGPYARWEPGSAAPGTYALTVNVDDGAGKTSICSTSVIVRPRPAPASPVMSCSVDRATVIVGERPQITANVNDPSGTALTYKWQSNGGQIVGMGSTVQLDTSGLAPGNYAVTGRVENGAGGAADCSAGVTVQAPPTPPEAAKIGECPFAQNSAVVNNVCKRVLDDVAVRLQTDSKAKAALVGFADPKERGASKLAGQRAENAKKYLGEKQGIDPARVLTRSAAGTPGEGKQNRRLDAVWIPDGATY